MTAGCIAGFLLLILLPYTRCQADLHLVTENNPPFNYIDIRTGQVAGLSIDILHEAAARAKLLISDIGLYPMVRALDLAQRQPNTCVFPVVRAPAREKLFKWVGPYVQNIWVFYARDDFKSKITSLEDAKHFRVGSDLYSAKTHYLVSKGFNTMDLMAEDAGNARKLSAGRFDLWIVGLSDGKIFADLSHITNIRPVFAVKSIDYYLACHLDFPAADIAALDTALKSMRLDGSAQRINDKYGTSLSHRLPGD